MDSRKVTRARDKVKGTGKWQINYPPAGGPYIRNSHCPMFKLPVQTRIKKMKIPIRLNYLTTTLQSRNQKGRANTFIGLPRRGVFYLVFYD